MQTAPQPTREPLGPQGEPCAECGAPLAADQRYCINCGRRRGEPRVAPASDAPPSERPRDGGRPNDLSPLGAVLGVALLGGMLLIGVLIGRGNSENDSPPPATIQVGEGTTATTATTPGGDAQDQAPVEGAGAVSSDWPAGTNGFTVQLNTVPKSGATQDTVDAARQAAEAKGVDEVGVIDSDLYPSLAPGNYVIYSGVFDARESATAALDDLSSSFPGATVIEVSDSGGD